MVAHPATSLAYTSPTIPTQRGSSRDTGVKHWLRRITPDRDKISEHKHLRVFGKLLHDPNLWHLNRRSAAGAFAVGLFVMYMPPVGQMFVAAAVAIAVRVNLPISVALVWITNPVTIPPMYYFAYLVGSWILGRHIESFHMDYWLDWHHWIDIFTPLTVGCLVCGAVCSVTGYFAVQGIWRWSLMRQIRRRKERLRKTITSPTARNL
jgi:uncharacterized protein (DUF2062 family)